MNDYLTAYRNRMQANHETFLQIAEQAKDRGFEVWGSKDGLISFIHIEGGNKHIIFGFTDVPYRWYLSYDIDMRLNQGSGRTLKEVPGTENQFTIEDIINDMQPNVKVLVPHIKYLKQL